MTKIYKKKAQISLRYHLKSIHPMTYNTLQHVWIQHVQSLSFHPYSFFKGLKNDKYASGEST